MTPRPSRAAIDAALGVLRRERRLAVRQQRYREARMSDSTERDAADHQAGLAVDMEDLVARLAEVIAWMEGQRNG